MINWYRKELQKYQNKHVLVTGASGFLGSRLFDILNLLKANTTGVTKSNSGSSDLMITCDLMNSDACETVFKDKQYDVIFHMAGWVSNDTTIPSFKKAVDNNVIPTLNVIQGIQNYMPNSNLVLPGSQLENSKSPTPYSLSKSVTSLYVNYFKKTHLANITTLEICATYGPNQHAHNLVPLTIQSLLNNKQLVLKLNRACNALYLDDTVNALLLAGLNPCYNKSLIISSEKIITVRDITNCISSLMQKDSSYISFESDDMLSDVILKQDQHKEETYNHLNWRPMWTLQEGIEQTISSYINKDH
tara:strand:- start:9961 stop:10869 length:909 start_codon:yes stop_codon:yes gene_type:complete